MFENYPAVPVENFDVTLFLLFREEGFNLFITSERISGESTARYDISCPGGHGFYPGRVNDIDAASVRQMRCNGNLRRNGYARRNHRNCGLAIPVALGHLPVVRRGQLPECEPRQHAETDDQDSEHCHVYSEFTRTLAVDASGDSP